MSLSRFHHHTQISRSVISPKQRPLLDNTQHSQQRSMPPAGFEPAVPASERPQTHVLDYAVTGTSTGTTVQTENIVNSISISIPWTAERRNIAVVHRKLLWHLCAAGYLNSGMQAVSLTNSHRGIARSTQAGRSLQQSQHVWVKSHAKCYVWSQARPIKLICHLRAAIISKRKSRKRIPYATANLRNKFTSIQYMAI